MKPRTFRRVVLLGSFGAVVLIMLLGYFVVRPWQNQRQLEAMRVDGLAAYERGDYRETMSQLGRYCNNAEEIEPEIYLKLARAAEKYEANDLGNIRVAITAYREYLRRVPDDIEASRELLPLLNTGEHFVEAERLARDLIDKHGQTDLEVYNELYLAMVMQQASDERIEPVMRTMYEHEESTYTEAIRYLNHLRNSGRVEEADALLDERLALHPDRVDERLLELERRVVQRGEETDDQAIVRDVSEIIGFDPESGAWAPDAPVLSRGAASFVERVFNALRRPGMAASVQKHMAEQTGDMINTIWAARRLYWLGRDDELMSMRVETPKGEPDSDVLGYQYLSARRAGDEAGISEALGLLEEVTLDRRARAWREYIKASELMEEGESVKARLGFEKALKIYQTEPTFRLTMGELQLAQGRFNEAIEQWKLASEIVNGEMGDTGWTNLRYWPDPMIRIVTTYADAGRLNEAGDYINELERVGIRDSESAIVVLSARAELARRGELPLDMGRRFLERWSESSEGMDDTARASIAPMVAEIMASMREKEMAAEEIRFALRTAPDNKRLIAQLADVDDRYALGVMSGLGLDLSAVADSTPRSVLRRASRVYDETGNLEDALEIFDEAMSEASEGEREDWVLVRTLFVDTVDRERAVPLWDELVEQNGDDVELLIQAIESNAYAPDLDRVNELIDRVVELTSTGGKTLPTRLRLARANAMVSGEGKQTKSNRDKALEIVRSVVVNEPGNVRARNMLGRLLAMTPSPNLPERERFEPDYRGAIEEYMTLSRQLNAASAQVYVLESFDLAFRMGDESRARELLQEYERRFGDDVMSLPTIAERYENLGDLERAAELYQRVYAGSGVLESGLSLADLWFKLGRVSQAEELLGQLRELETLDADALLRLASLYARSGNTAEGELVASAGERYGLDPYDAKMLYARYAGLFMSSEEQLRALREATELDPSRRAAWVGLLRELTRVGRYEEAREAYARAVESIELDDELARLGVLAEGGPTDNPEELLDMPGMRDNPVLKTAIERVGAYSRLGDDTSAQTRLDELSRLIDEFPQVEPVQTFCVRQLATLELDPRQVVPVMERAQRNAPSSTVIMRIAGEMYLRAGMPEQAVRSIDLWRANTLERSVVANAIRARALIQLERYDEAEQELNPFIDEAMNAVDIPVNREVIDAYCHVRLKLGEDPEVISARLRPLIERSGELRTRTWLGLASGVIEDATVAEEWIRTAETLAQEGDRPALADAWIALAFNHGRWEPRYAQAALEQLEPLIRASDRPDPAVLLSQAKAQVILARGSDDPQVARDAYGDAVDTLLRSADLDTANLLPLLEAARYASEGGLMDRSVEIYRRVLGLGLSDSPLKAMVDNNLAMATLRLGVSPEQKDELFALAEEATRLQPEVASYWGTRGWVELAFDDAEAAEDSFRRCRLLDPEGAEGLTGLLIVLQVRGETGAEFDRLRDRVEELRRQGQLSADLIEKLAEHGLEG